MKTCEREGCRQEAIDKERYCKQCKKKVLQALKEAGYLQRVNRFDRKYRPLSHQEDTNDTKYGNDR